MGSVWYIGSISNGLGLIVYSLNNLLSTYFISLPLPRCPAGVAYSQGPVWSSCVWHIIWTHLWHDGVHLSQGAASHCIQVWQDQWQTSHPLPLTGNAHNGHQPRPVPLLIWTGSCLWYYCPWSNCISCWILINYSDHIYFFLFFFSHFFSIQELFIHNYVYIWKYIYWTLWAIQCIWIDQLLLFFMMISPLVMSNEFPSGCKLTTSPDLLRTCR